MSRQIDSGIAENFFRRDGRLNRWRYFKRMLLIGVIEIIILSVIFVIDVNALGELSTPGNAIVNLVCFAGMIPFYCLGVRRLHDMGKSDTLIRANIALDIFLTLAHGKNFLVTEPSLALNILSVVSGVIGLYILLWPGTRGANQYGSDPLAP